MTKSILPTKTHEANTEYWYKFEYWYKEVLKWLLSLEIGQENFPAFTGC